MNNIKPTPEEIFDHKRDDKTYVSPKFSHKETKLCENGESIEEVRPMRKISHIITSSESHEHIVNGDEIILRTTAGERQEVIANVFEDTRGIITLKVAKYNKKSGTLFNGDLTLSGSEILEFINFINSIAYLPINQSSSMQFADQFLQKHIITKEQALNLLRQFPELVEEISKGNVSSSDITELTIRKEGLSKFEQMLVSSETTEKEWQDFFESNTWIFGYGLNFVFNAALDDKKMEQVVSGYDVANSGKKIDALLSRRGAIEATCFVEIKKHNTDLLEGRAYRPECFAISKELAGAVAQIQKTIQKTLYSLNDKFTTQDDDCNPLKTFYNYQPKGYVIVGSLNEFATENGINEVKYSSFELFRRNISNPEILTFDELYERAKFIVNTTN